MEFDGTRVYTAVNAEQVPVGTRCLLLTLLQSCGSRLQVELGAEFR